jgi:hypothetical protein
MKRITYKKTNIHGQYLSNPVMTNHGHVQFEITPSQDTNGGHLGLVLFTNGESERIHGKNLRALKTNFRTWVVSNGGHVGVEKKTWKPKNTVVHHEDTGSVNV